MTIMRKAFSKHQYCPAIKDVFPSCKLTPTVITGYVRRICLLWTYDSQIRPNSLSKWQVNVQPALER